MAIYVAMRPPGGEREKMVFVRDGFHLFAFLIPVLWFLRYRMWIEAVLTLAVLLLVGAVEQLNGTAGAVLSLLLAVALGLEAPALRIWALRRRGWREDGVAEGENQGDAELRFFLGGEADGQAPPTGGAFANYRGRSTGPALGLLDPRGFA